MVLRIVLLLCTAIAMAQIGPPRAGFIRDRAGALRPVHGVAGAFVLGEAVETGVLSAGFSGKLGFVKTASELIVFRDGFVVDRIEAPTGPAEFTFGARPAIYFVDTGELWEWPRRTGWRAARSVADLHCDYGYVVLASGERVRTPEPAMEVERMSEEWAVARTESALYAIRITGTERTIVQLPELPQ
jgi:hypothetical protein